MMKRFSLILILGLTLGAAPGAAQGFEVAGWIPFWTPTAGPNDARAHLKKVTELNPFAYSVKLDGTLKDLAGLKKSAWKKLFKAARAENTLLLPSVMMSSGAEIHRLLSNPPARAAHIKTISQMIEKGQWDGVDIDYEGKWAETKDYFSLFLTELKLALGAKTLSCTIESRTPPDSLYSKLPADGLHYANDYQVIGEVCDRIKIMTYDQRNADIKLNAAHASTNYFPVADLAWVEKVARFATVFFPREKIMLGIPTYGHEYEVSVSPSGQRSYTRVSSINPQPARQLARKNQATLERQPSGEIGFVYQIKDAAPGVTRFVTWSDAEAIKQKINLARGLGLAGVAIFKLDGGEDPNLWKSL